MVNYFCFHDIYYVFDFKYSDYFYLIINIFNILLYQTIIFRMIYIFCNKIQENK